MKGRYWRRRGLPNGSRRPYYVVLLVSLAATLLVPAPAAQGHMYYDVPSNCGSLHHEEYVSGGQSNWIAPYLSYARIHSNNEVRYEHCYNDHGHTLLRWNGSYWSWVDWTMCGRWEHSDWAYNHHVWYQCDSYWTVPAGYWYYAEADYYAISNKFVGLIGRGGHWDYDESSAEQCIYYHGGTSWTTGC